MNPRDAATVMAHDGSLGVMDMEIMRNRAPFAVPDSVYWSKEYRQTISGVEQCSCCDECSTWAYKVTISDHVLTLVLLDAVSRHPEWAPNQAVLTRDSLTNIGTVWCEDRPAGRC